MRVPICLMILKSPHLIMPKKECPSCAMMIDKREKVCPICQYEFPTQAKGVTWIAVLLVVLFLLLIFL